MQSVSVLLLVHVERRCTQLVTMNRNCADRNAKYMYATQTRRDGQHERLYKGGGRKSWSGCPKFLISDPMTIVHTVFLNPLDTFPLRRFISPTVHPSAFLPNGSRLAVVDTGLTQRTSAVYARYREKSTVKQKTTFSQIPRRSFVAMAPCQW